MASSASWAMGTFLCVLVAGLVAGACSTPQPLPGFSIATRRFARGRILPEGMLVNVPGSPCLQVKPLGGAAVGLFWLLASPRQRIRSACTTHTGPRSQPRATP